MFCVGSGKGWYGIFLRASGCFVDVVPRKGLESLRLSAADFEFVASIDSVILAWACMKHVRGVRIIFDSRVSDKSKYSRMLFIPADPCHCFAC